MGFFVGGTWVPPPSVRLLNCSLRPPLVGADLSISSPLSLSLRRQTKHWKCVVANDNDVAGYSPTV